MKSGFYGTKMKQTNPIKTFKIEFEDISTIKRSKNGHKHFSDLFLLQVDDFFLDFSRMPYFFEVIRSFRLSTL